MIAPWRSVLARAIHCHSEPQARYVQLATVSATGMPHNRTIVFRGFEPDCDVLRFITDRRSEKVADIEHCAFGEVCWYFPKTREQFRLFGSLILVDAQNIDRGSQRLAMWHELSAKAQAQFLWPDPGKERQKTDRFEQEFDREIIPNTFCLLLLETRSVDHLTLRGEPQNRVIYHFDGLSWTDTIVNP